MAVVKKRLGEMLVDAGIIDETQLHAALGHQRQWGGRLGAVLVELKLASEEAIVDALALKFGYEIAKLDRLEAYAFEQAKALVPKDYAVRNRIFPIAADTGLLVVAMSDPTNLSLTDELSFKSGRRIKVCIAGENAIAAAIRAHYGEDALPQREAIALDVDDGTAVEPLYDPIGATSSEELNRFFQQAPEPAPAPAARAPAARPVAARAAPAPSAPARRPPASAQPAPPVQAPPRARPPAAGALQLEDQHTESLPLEAEPPLEELTEELQPIPLEPLVEGEQLYEPPASPGGQAEEEWVEGPVRSRELTPEEVQILDALGRMAVGDDATPTVVRPAQLLASLIRLLMRKQLITEQELLDEILRG